MEGVGNVYTFWSSPYQPRYGMIHSHEKVGKGHIYFPRIQKSEYSNQSINKLVDGYFQGSFKSMVSFFMKKNDISLSELEEIMKTIKEDK